MVIVRYYIPRRLYLCQYSIHVDHVDWWWPWPRLFATLNAGEKKSCFHFIQPALSALVSVRVIRQWNHTVLSDSQFSMWLLVTQWHTLCGWTLCCVATCTEYTPLPLFTTISLPSFSYLLLPFLLLLLHHLLSRPPLSSPHSALSAIYSKLPTQPLPATILRLLILRPLLLLQTPFRTLSLPPNMMDFCPNFFFCHLRFYLPIPNILSQQTCWL